MLDYPGGPSKTTRMLGSGRGRQESQRSCDDRSEIRMMPLLALQIGPQAKECSQLLEVGKVDGFSSSISQKTITM